MSLGSFAHLRDEKTAGTTGGTFTGGAWQTRDLNTIKSDVDGIIGSLTASEFTLDAGDYFIYARVPGFAVDRHRARLYNVSDSAVVLYGSSKFGPNSSNAGEDSEIIGSFTLSGTKTLRIEHYADTTKTTYGYGVEHNHGHPEVYTEVWILRVGTDRRISDLSDADPLDGTEYFVVAQGGQSRRLLAADLPAPEIYSAAATADATHSPDPTSATTVDDMSVTFTLDDTRDVAIHFSAVAVKSGGGSHIGFKDGSTDLLPASFYTFDPGESDRKIANCMFVAEGLTAGSHTITVYWTAQGNTNAITWKQRSLVVTVIPA